MIAARIALIAAALAALVRPAAAESDVLVIGEGGTERLQVAAIRGAIENALRKDGWSWPSKSPTRKEADRLLQCDNSVAPWACLPASISGLRAPQIKRVFVASIQAVPPKSAGDAASVVVITARAIAATAPPSFVVRQRYCEGASESELAAAAEALTVQLVHELAIQRGATALAIRSTPPDAQVFLDGEQAGVTGARLPTFPGRHSARIEKPGFAAEQREVTIEDGQTLELEVALRAHDLVVTHDPEQEVVRPAPTVRRAPSRLAPGLVIGAGVGLLGFAGWGFYLGHKAGPDEEFLYPRANKLAIASSIAGAAAVGAGVWWLFHRAGDAEPIVATTPSSFLVGWSTPF